MTCPWCGFMGRAVRTLRVRPSRKRTRMCPACFGEVDPALCAADDRPASRYEGAEEAIGAVPGEY